MSITDIWRVCVNSQ